jgi:hypothetical protein
MKRSVLWRILFLAVVVLVLGACAKPPTDEVDAANLSLARAEADADAREYAPDSLSDARSLVVRMESELEAKSYDAAKNLALEAAEAARKAIDDGASGKTRARSEAISLISSAKTSLEEVQQSLSVAKRVRGLSLDVNATEGDINVATQTITAADDDLSKTDFKAASSKAQSARSMLSGITQRVSAAVQKATRRK